MTATDATKKFLPQSTQGDTQINFVRTYINKSGTIEPIPIKGWTFPTAPSDKSILIKDGGKSSSVILAANTDNITFTPKTITSLSTGIYNKAIKGVSGSDYGCVNDTFTTAYITGNSSYDFTMCKSRVRADFDTGINLKADGGKGVSSDFSIDSGLLTDLKAVAQVKCQDPAKGVGCDQTKNVIQVGSFLAIDRSASTDSSWAAILGPTGPLAIWQILSSPTSIPFAYKPVDLYVQIYPSEEAWKANINEPIPSDVPKATDAESGAAASEQTVSQTLYGFIVRVISSLITLLQQIIFWIFATILVPVIKALLSVRPYEDAFVNVIYPGWLILRNLSNIFFIVALLVVGMKILFQQAASGTAMSFIRRLVVMALLVNFSLVIGQGIIGIADTVQSQFLPAESKVIEALGAKLMVEPLKVFRAEVIDTSGGQAAGGAFTAKNAELSIADTLKPLVLLLLIVAAFWSFVALAAFLLVRLVALWVLYMVSPIAYVFFVMEDTRSYASRWWKEFLKYAMVTPILAFFLNIAALMASAFAGNQNQGLFRAFSDGSVPADLVVNILTFISHFFVLVILFAGMKFAMSSGTYGAAAITKFAQKGFVNSFKKPAQWAGGIKDGIANSVSNKLEDKGWNKSANFLTAATKPVDYLKAVKKAQIDDRTAKREKEIKERFAGTFGARGAADDTSKLGSSLNEGRKLQKDFEMDTPEFLGTKMQEAKKKRDKDLMAGAMLGMAKGGHFKDALKEGKEILGKNKDYADNRNGLNQMTSDMVEKGYITEDNRRDLLYEFDQAAKKKRKDSQYGGNVTYDRKNNKVEVRKLDRDGDYTQINKDGSITKETYNNEKSTIREQIKARSASDKGGSLKKDLVEASKSAVVNDNGRFTKEQIGVFANQQERNLNDHKTWADFARNTDRGKQEYMLKAVDDRKKRDRDRGDMEEYLTALYKEENKGRSPGDREKDSIKREAFRKVSLYSRKLGANLDQDELVGISDIIEKEESSKKKEKDKDDQAKDIVDAVATDTTDSQDLDDDDEDVEGSEETTDAINPESSPKQINTNVVVAQAQPGPSSITGVSPIGVAYRQDQPINFTQSGSLKVGTSSFVPNSDAGPRKVRNDNGNKESKKEKQIAQQEVKESPRIQGFGRNVTYQRHSVEPAYQSKLGDTSKKYDDSSTGSPISKPFDSSNSNISGNLGGDQVLGSRPVDLGTPKQVLTSVNPPRSQSTDAAVPETPKAIDFGNEKIKDETTGEERNRIGLNVGKIKVKQTPDTAPSGVSRLFTSKKDKDVEDERPHTTLAEPPPTPPSATNSAEPQTNLPADQTNDKV